MIGEIVWTHGRSLAEGLVNLGKKLETVILLRDIKILYEEPRFEGTCYKLLLLKCAAK